MLKIVSSTLRDTKYLDKIYIMYFFTLSFYMHIFFLLIRKIFSFYISKHLPCVRTYVQQYQLEKTSIYGFEWSWHLITKNLNQTIQTEMTSVHLHFNERNSNMSLIFKIDRLLYPIFSGLNHLQNSFLYLSSNIKI